MSVSVEQKLIELSKIVHHDQNFDPEQLVASNGWQVLAQNLFIKPLGNRLRLSIEFQYFPNKKISRILVSKERQRYSFVPKWDKVSYNCYVQSGDVTSDKTDQVTIEDRENFYGKDRFRFDEQELLEVLEDFIKSVFSIYVVAEGSVHSLIQQSDEK